MTGGVYGEEVTLKENAEVQDPVMAKESIELNGSVVRGDVGTPGKIEGESGYVHGTVTGKRVRLEDMVVIGNVVAQNLILDNSVVLGIATGKRLLEISDTTCYTFKSYTEGKIENTDIILPQAVADGDLSLEDPISVLSIPLRREGDSEEDEENTLYPNLTADDTYEHDGVEYITLAPRLPVARRVRRAGR
ncbi:MAG: hypothetical protein SV760_04965, partial [Halobacteria archaeon]|nr:hypothetical protein [Halobacteria archaeon]